MSRSGYDEDADYDQWAFIRWRGVVASSIRGKRGQAFLRELVDALDAMPEKRLIAHDLQIGGEVCAIGSVGARRGIDMTNLDPQDPDTIASVFGIATPLVQEIEWMNDEAFYRATPERRWVEMRAWVAKNLKSDTDRSPKGGDGEAGSMRSTTAGPEGIAQ